MKNAAYIPVLIFILLSSFVAAAPELLSEVALNGTTPSIQMKMHSIDETQLILLDNVAGTCRLRIANPTTGQVTDQNTFACSYAHDVHYDAGTITVCTTYFLGGTGSRHQIKVYKYPEPGFLQPKGGYNSPYGAGSFYGGCEIDSSSSNSADIFVGNLYFAASTQTGVVKIWFNGSSATFTQYPITVPPGFNRLTDENNEIFGTSNDFYDNSDPYNHTGKILDSTVLGDILRAWNFDSASPEWVSANGYIAIASDYSDITESSGSVTMDDVIAYGGRDEILGIINGWWYQGDFSITPGAPTLTNTSVEITNYDPAPDTRTYEYLTTSTNIYYYNETNDILSTWEYQAAPTCIASNGCYMDEPFIYGDSVLNHGWSGWSVEPINGQLQCFGSTQYTTYQITPITPGVGTFYVEFDARICGDPTGPLEMSLFSNNDALVQLRFTGDSANGTIQDHTGAYLTESLGNTVADPGNLTCSGTNRFENNYILEIFPQNNPRTYNLYVNGVIVSQNNLWTTVGQQVFGVNSIGFSGGISPVYCFWSIDNVKIYTSQVNDPDLTDDEINDERNTIGGEVMSLDTQFHFDRDAHCETTENTQLCFLSWVVGGLLNWLWRMIVNNPLPSLAFILVAVVLVIAGHNAGRK